MKNLFRKFLFVLLFLVPQLLFAGVMERPRKVYSYKTPHFDILFPAECSSTAKIVADNAEIMYEDIAKTYNYTFQQSIAIIISPDSDTLSVNYAPTPLNRIVIYDSAPSSEDQMYRNRLLDMLNHAIKKGVLSMVTTDFFYWWRKNVFGPGVQPAVLLNVPFSFLEGAVCADDYNHNTGLLDDNRNLQKLIQAKIDNKFPTLIQVLGTYDIYPGPEFCRLAASAFCAYIQYRFGYEKFIEYWNMGGQVNFFFLHKGIFKKVYEISMEEVWNDFVDQIPLPELAEAEDSEIFFTSPNKSLYKFLLHSQFGYLWYDELKGEVAIYDDTPGFQKRRRLLFLANDITDLTLSPDGRFLVVSHTQQGSRENFKINEARIYDLKTRSFTGDKYNLREASFIQLDDGTYAVAGIDVESKYPKLRIIPADKTNNFLDLYYAKNSSAIYTREFNSDTIPHNPIQIGENTLAYLISTNQEKYLSILNYITGKEHIFQIKFEDEILNINNIKLNNIGFLAISKTSSSYAIMFDYISKFQPSLSKAGMILLNKDNSLQQVIVQTDNLSGGISDPLFFGSSLFYSRHLHDQDEFRKIPISKVNFAPAELIYPEVEFKEIPEYKQIPITEKTNEKGKKEFYLDEYKLKNFNPIPYLLRGAPIPFMPVKNVTLSDGIELSPGLGISFTTGADPFFNNELTVSAGFGFIPTDITMIFNASEDERKDFDIPEIKFFDDFTFATYYKNSSTPIDLLAAGIIVFNKAGQYDLNILAGSAWEVPLMMTFRRFKFSFESKFNASTSYWDQHQDSTFPVLYNWPDFKDSYRSLDTMFEIRYSNIHQFGLSPLKKMGIEAGIALKATWDINLMELQWEKRKSGTIESVKPENLTQAIENQLWSNPYAPTQINAGMYAIAEIPQLMPFLDIENWITTLPTTITAELFYTNGIALDVNLKFLLVGKEIQNGFNMFNIYFPRAGLYFGYDVQRKYDTNTVALPDVRNVFRFYDAFANTVLNDSLYLDLNILTTPIVGQFSANQIASDFIFEYYIRSHIFKFNFNMKFVL